MRKFKHSLFKGQREDRWDGSGPATVQKRKHSDFPAEGDTKLSLLLPRPSKNEPKLPPKPKRATEGATPAVSAHPKLSFKESDADRKSSRKFPLGKFTPLRDPGWGSKALIMKIFSNSFKGTCVDLGKAPSTPGNLSRVKSDFKADGQPKLASIKSLHRLPEKPYLKSLPNESGEAFASATPNDAHRDTPFLDLNKIYKNSLCSLQQDASRSLQNSQAKMDKEPLPCNSSLDRNGRLDPKDIVDDVRSRLSGHKKLREFMDREKTSKLTADQTLQILSALGLHEADGETDCQNQVEEFLVAQLFFEALKVTRNGDTKVELDSVLSSLVLIRSLDRLGLLVSRRPKASAETSLNSSLAKPKKKSSLSNKGPSFSPHNSFVNSVSKLFDERPSNVSQANKMSPPTASFSKSQSPVDRTQKDFEQYDCSQFTFKKQKKESTKSENGMGFGEEGVFSGSPATLKENLSSEANRQTQPAQSDLRASSEISRPKRLEDGVTRVSSAKTIPKKPSIFHSIESIPLNSERPLFSTTITFHHRKIPLDVFESDKIPELVAAFIATHGIDPAKQALLEDILEREKSEKLLAKNGRLNGF